MPADLTRTGVIVVVASAAVCLGAAALLVGAGLRAAGDGPFGSPELTVAAAVVAVVGALRLAVAVHRIGS